MDEEPVTITLDAERAIVLSDLLWRWEQPSGSPYPSDDCFESPAEVRVLIDLLRDIEAQLVAPFKSDYDKIVERARASLAEGFEDMTLRLEP
jgi:hypothetical protein